MSITLTVTCCDLFVLEVDVLNSRLQALGKMVTHFKADYMPTREQ